MCRLVLTNPVHICSQVPFDMMPVIVFCSIFTVFIHTLDMGNNSDSYTFSMVDKSIWHVQEYCANVVDPDETDSSEIWDCFFRAVLAGSSLYAQGPKL